MGIYTGENQRIGFIHTMLMPRMRHGLPGAMSTVSSKLTMNLLSKPTELIISGSFWTADEGGRSDIDFRVRSMGHTMSLEGSIFEGESKFEIGTGGERFPLSFPVGSDVFFSDSIGATNLNLPTLEVGQEILVDSFDPLTLSRGKAHIVCVGEETLQVMGKLVHTKVVTTTIGGITSKAWVTYDGEVVRAETPLGFSLQMITKEEALSQGTEGDAEGLIAMMAVHPTGKRPFRGAKRMTVRISGVAEDTRPPTDDVQRVDAGVYTIQPVLPPWDEPDADAGAPDLAEHFQGDPLIQVGHPKIVSAAEAVVGEETDTWKKAQLIYDWVNESIEKVIVPSFPSALEVLETRQGDCNEHTVLYAALARSVEVPTRIAIGVVWSDEMDGFFYHAWPEVYVGRWVWMDPTLGQPIADATHIKLLTGDIAKWFQLIPYLGQLKVEVIEVE